MVPLWVLTLLWSLLPRVSWGPPSEWFSKVLLVEFSLCPFLPARLCWRAALFGSDSLSPPPHLIFRKSSTVLVQAHCVQGCGAGEGKHPQVQYSQAGPQLSSNILEGKEQQKALRCCERHLTSSKPYSFILMRCNLSGGSNQDNFFSEFARIIKMVGNGLSDWYAFQGLPPATGHYGNSLAGFDKSQTFFSKTCFVYFHFRYLLWNWQKVVHCRACFLVFFYRKGLRLVKTGLGVAIMPLCWRQTLEMQYTLMGHKGNLEVVSYLNGSFDIWLY